MKIRTIFSVIVIISILALLLKSSVEDLLLKHSGHCVKATIVNETTRVKYHKADYKYQFQISGQTYTGNSLVTDHTGVGETICIVYLESKPSINRPVSYFNHFDRCECEK